MWISRIVVNGEVAYHAAVNEFIADELGDEHQTVGEAEFHGQGYFDLPGDLAIKSFFSRFNGVPKALPIQRPRSSMLGCGNRPPRDILSP